MIVPNLNKTVKQHKYIIPMWIYGYHAINEPDDDNGFLDDRINYLYTCSYVTTFTKLFRNYIAR